MTAENPVATLAPRPVRAVAINLDDPVALYLDTGVFEQIQRVAKLMSTSALAPKHLQGPEKIADAFLVVAQAFRWRMDPFSVAQHTFVYQGKLGYEGKLIAAVVNSSGKLERNLDYRYEGQGAARKVTVIGRFKGEKEDRVVDGTVKDWATNNDKWKSLPDQMLAYRGAREWSRRYMPEVILGVSADEEVQAINVREPMQDITPPKPAHQQLAEQIQALPATGQPIGGDLAPAAPPIDATEPPADRADVS